MHRLRPSLRARALLALLAIVAVGAAMSATACGGSAPVANPKWDARSVAASIKGAPFTPIQINSNVGKERTRLAIALFKPDQTLVLDAQVTGRIFRIANDPEKDPAQGTLLTQVDFTSRTIDVAAEHEGHSARFDRSDRAGRTVEVALRTSPAGAIDAAVLPAHDGALSTVFTALVGFNEAGMWGAQLQVKTGGRTYNNLLVTFAVQEKTAEPMIGSTPPATRQKIAKDVSDLAEISSATKPMRELQDITVADAMASGKPTLVAFVTPAFCQTRFCGPVLNTVVIPAYQQYKGRVNVIHIEPVDLATARKGQLVGSAAFTEWNLRTEPFLFVLDGKGRVAAKFEGIIEFAEVKQALDAALAAK